jgi:hypothetical protein
MYDAEFLWSGIMNSDESPSATPPSSSHRAARVRIGISLAFVIAIGVLIVERQTRPTLLYGPMVQIPEPGGLTIVWGMDGFFSTGTVTLFDGSNLFTTSAPCVKGRCEISFTKLGQGNKFTYEIANDRAIFGKTKLAGPFDTKTAMPRGKPFRFAAFGDSGNGSNTQTEFAKRITASKPDLIIHVGDLVYPTGLRSDYLRNFFRPNEEMIRTAPFMPTEGNHDVAT